jgi:hypothetical protein
MASRWNRQQSVREYSKNENNVYKSKSTYCTSLLKGLKQEVEEENEEDCGGSLFSAIKAENMRYSKT